MQVCYCLTSDGKDLHAATTHISIVSLRRHHPDAKVIVVADAESKRALDAAAHPLLNSINEMVSLDTPSGSAGWRNRFVKTQLRQVVAGTLLYLDGDTVVRAPIDEIFATTASVAAVPNHNSDNALDSTFGDEIAVLKENGWELPSLPYVNGGVLLMTDRAATRKFSDLWHRKWLSLAGEGKHHDQPALNSALTDSGIDCFILPHRFDAQVQVRPRTALGAQIWHIYAALPSELAPRTGWHQLVSDHLATGQLDLKAVQSFCDQRYPWRQSSLLDALVIRIMLRRWDFLPVDSFERTWLAGRRRDALRILKRLMTG